MLRRWRAAFEPSDFSVHPSVVTSALPIEPAAHDNTVGEFIESWRRERPGLDYEWLKFVLLIHRSQKLLRRDVRSIIPKLGYGNAEFEVLTQLRAAGAPYALRPTDLFQSLAVTSGAMTGRIDRLIALGWVTRERSPSDKRAALIRLTPAGIEASNRLVEYGATQSTMARALAGMGADDRAHLSNLLQQLYLLLEASAADCESIPLLDNEE